MVHIPKVIIIFLFFSKALFSQEITIKSILKNSDGLINNEKVQAIIEGTNNWSALDTSLAILSINSRLADLKDPFFIWYVCPGHKSKRFQFNMQDTSKYNYWKQSDNIFVDIGDIVLEKIDAHVSLVNVSANVTSNINDTISLSSLNFFSTEYNTRNLLKDSKKNKVLGSIPYPCQNDEIYFLVWQIGYKSFGFCLKSSSISNIGTNQYEDIKLEQSNIKKITYNNSNTFSLKVNSKKVESPVYFGPGGQFQFGRHEFIANDGFFKYSRSTPVINKDTIEKYPFNMNDYSPKFEFIEIPQNADIDEIQIIFTIPIKIIESFNYYFNISSKYKSEKPPKDNEITNDFNKGFLSLRWVCLEETIYNDDGTAIKKGKINIPLSYLKENGFIKNENDFIKIDFFAYPFKKGYLYKPFFINTLIYNQYKLSDVESSIGFRMKYSSDNIIQTPNYNIIGVRLSSIIFKKASGEDYRFMTIVDLTFGFDYNLKFEHTTETKLKNKFSFYFSPSYSATVISNDKIFPISFGSRARCNFIYYDKSYSGKDQYSIKF
ncbi:MAG: hypothetical protein ACTSRG_25615, partial [Candidatus Helarchaeota archaeon]